MHSPSESAKHGLPCNHAPLRVLVVDDDSMVRRVCKALLELLGHTVAEAADGNDALRMLTRFEADVILLDMLMPEKDGVETLRELRRIDPITPVIAMSGGSRVDAALCLRFATNLGAPLVLLKPFTADELDAVIGRAIQQRNAGAGANRPADSAP